MRSASSLTGKRVRKDPAFAETRRYAGMMARASKIGSHVYRQISGKRKTHAVYRMLTGEAMGMIKDGVEEHEIVRVLTEVYL